MMLTTASKVSAAKRFARNGQYAEAAAIVEKIRLAKVSSVHELSTLASILLRLKRYEEAKKIYLEMYSRAKTHKVMVGLIDLCLKTQEPKQAERFLREFRKMEPENPERLVFRYRVDCMLGKSNEYLLKSLTKLKEEDYTDIWALELAKVYFKENDMVACAKECRDILLWFPDSEVVPKAKVLLGACEDVFEENEAQMPEEPEAAKQTAAANSVEVVEITNPKTADLSEEKNEPVVTPEKIEYDRILFDDDDDDDDDDEYVIRDYFVSPEEKEKAPEAEAWMQEVTFSEADTLEAKAPEIDLSEDAPSEDTSEPEEALQEASTEHELTEAAIAAMDHEDDDAIERALYELLKKSEKES